MVKLWEVCGAGQGQGMGGYFGKEYLARRLIGEGPHTEVFYFSGYKYNNLYFSGYNNLRYSIKNFPQTKTPFMAYPL